jgi:hypothetical protein
MYRTGMIQAHPPAVGEQIEKVMFSLWTPDYTGFLDGFRFFDMTRMSWQLALEII